VPSDGPPGVGGSAGGGRDVDDRWRTGRGGVAVPEMVGRRRSRGGGGGRLGGGGVRSVEGCVRGPRPRLGKTPVPIWGRSAGFGGSGGGVEHPT